MPADSRLLLRLTKCLASHRRSYGIPFDYLSFLT
jgi:hypothetical protein